MCDVRARLFPWLWCTSGCLAYAHRHFSSGCSLKIIIIVRHFGDRFLEKQFRRVNFLTFREQIIVGMARWWESSWMYLYNVQCSVHAPYQILLKLATIPLFVKHMTARERKNKEVQKKVEIYLVRERESIPETRRKRKEFFHGENSIYTDIFEFRLSSFCFDFSARARSHTHTPQTSFAWRYQQTKAHAMRSSIFSFSVSSARIPLFKSPKIYSWWILLFNGKEHVAAFSSTNSRTWDMNSVAVIFKLNYTQAKSKYECIFCIHRQSIKSTVSICMRRYHTDI